MEKVDVTILPTPAIYNGYYTIKNRETGEHRTFRVRTQPDDAKFAPGERVIALLTGPDNTRDYTGFGFVTWAGIKVWGKKSQEGKVWGVYAKLLWLLATSAETPLHHRYEVLLSKRCVRCNRELTDPVSIALGIGPKCRGGA